MSDYIVQYNFPQTFLPFDPRDSSAPTPNNGEAAAIYSGSVTIDYTTGQVAGAITLDSNQLTSFYLDVTSNYLVADDGGRNTVVIFGIEGQPSTLNNVQAIESYRTRYQPNGEDRFIAFDAPVMSTAVCFASGTLIRTARGDVAVEALAVDDIVVTASDAHRPIRWIGSRTIDCRFAGKHNVLPVRVRAHAFAPYRPARDLVLSPGHALCLDLVGEVLIPAAALINGTTVVQEDVDTITYWHVELDSHDILLAENMPAESYFDMGNRGFFAGSNVVYLAATPEVGTSQRTHADFCRPFHAEGALVDAVRARMRRRLPALGWQLVEPEPWIEVMLIVDGAIVRPKVRGLSACFELPAGGQEIWLTCPTGVPREVSDSRDDRALGLCLAAISLSDGLGAPRAVALDNPLLQVGFYGHEGVHRWTAGRAKLPVELLAGLTGTVFLSLELSAPPIKQWLASAADDALVGADITGAA